MHVADIELEIEAVKVAISKTQTVRTIDAINTELKSATDKSLIKRLNTELVNARDELQLRQKVIVLTGKRNEARNEAELSEASEPVTKITAGAMKIDEKVTYAIIHLFIFITPDLIGILLWIELINPHKGDKELGNQNLSASPIFTLSNFKNHASLAFMKLLAFLGGSRKTEPTLILDEDQPLIDLATPSVDQLNNQKKGLSDLLVELDAGRIKPQVDPIREYLECAQSTAVFTHRYVVERAQSIQNDRVKSE
jgi:hypothetical protein